MIRTTPFHERTAALNETQLWSHWSGHLAADRYQMSDKFEYFSVRNAAGIFDSSPLYKYRIAGKDAERFLSGILARDIRACPPGHAQYTCWLDDRGFVIEDGVILRRAKDDYLLTSAEPNFAYFADRIGRLDVTIEELSHDIGTLAIQGPRSRDLLAKLVPQMERIPYFGLAKGEIGGAPVTVSRTGYSGDLGYEIWIESPDALHVWDTLWDSVEGHGVLPFGLAALYMLRIEAGLLLLEADFDSSRYAWNDAHRSTPIELGWTWMFKDLGADDRPFIGRKALEREIADKTSRWNMRGLIVDWRDYDRVYNEAGLIPPKDHAPVVEDWMVYDDDYQRVGYATSFMYSPMLQRHIAIARVRPDFAKLGTKVNLEFTVDHHYEQVAAHVARLPLYNPERKTA
ncbi:MAG TPA: aminomethyltransferase family protein [Candidatus Saccharimonadales bacterium]|nr:aminomethyltransferase family protein [Candidatus Saccharimonadales bacterium]